MSIRSDLRMLKTELYHEMERIRNEISDLSRSVAYNDLTMRYSQLLEENERLKEESKYRHHEG